MTYRDHEILARVCGTYSDLYELKDDGSLVEESEDILIKNQDEEIVWYEAEVINPITGFSGWDRFKTIEDAKRSIDQSIAYSKRYR
jgi:hypothetical protein